MPLNVLNSIAKLPKKTAAVVPNWVAVGDTDGANRIATSTNGITWTGQTSNCGLTRTFGVAYGKDGSGNGLWVAVGSGGNTIATSTDGTTWTGQTANGGLSTNGRGVAYGKDGSNNNLWVAVGSGTNTIATSPNGTNWTGQTANGGLNTNGLGVAFTPLNN